jgi:hypothetical protein
MWGSSAVGAFLGSSRGSCAVKWSTQSAACPISGVAMKNGEGKIFAYSGTFASLSSELSGGLPVFCLILPTKAPSYANRRPVLTLERCN